MSDVVRKDDDEQVPLSRQLAIALKYDDDNDPAPMVIAKGRGSMAQRILELAKEKDIPIKEDLGLAESLASLNLGDTIPAELFPAIAEVLAFVYRMNKSYLK